MKLETEAYGRSIEVEIANELDHFGQFRVTLYVGGKERYAACFNDKSEDIDFADPPSADSL